MRFRERIFPGTNYSIPSSQSVFITNDCPTESYVSNSSPSTSAEHSGQHAAQLQESPFRDNDTISDELKSEIVTTLDHAEEWYDFRHPKPMPMVQLLLPNIETPVQSQKYDTKFERVTGMHGSYEWQVWFGSDQFGRRLSISRRPRDAAIFTESGYIKVEKALLPRRDGDKYDYTITSSTREPIGGTIDIFHQNNPEAAHHITTLFSEFLQATQVPQIEDLPDDLFT